jgi:ATP-dependent RNA helicase DOB1
LTVNPALHPTPCVQVREDLEAPFAALLETARRVGKAANEAGLVLDTPEYAASFRPDLMELLSAWAGGAKFADLLRLTDIFEVGGRLRHA